MSAALAVQAKAAPALAQAARRPILQRMCACGGALSAFTGECESCAGASPRVQTKLRIGGVGDAYEREADRVAAQVLDGATGAVKAAPAPTGVERRVDHDFSRLDVHPTAGDAAAAEAALPDGAMLTHGGAPLPHALRAFFEPRFGRELGEVRVHAGQDAEHHNDRLQAHAFTYANHIWLGRGHRPEPGFLLAHELAHVIQQRQPRLLPGADAAPLEPAAPAVQKLDLGGALPFWIPLGRRGRRTGPDIHRELLGYAETGNIDREAPAPNARNDDWGLDYQGSVDLYRGTRGGHPHVMPGLYFEGPVGDKGADPLVVEPRTHRETRRRRRVPASFAPAVEGRSITRIGEAPDDIALGELKPASREMVDRGQEQIGLYIEGLRDAQRLTNAYARYNSRTPEEWNPRIRRLRAQEVTFQRAGADLGFDPNQPRADTELVLGEIKEVRQRGGKYRVTVTFNPAAEGLPPVMGGLYVNHYRNGVWMYFARPANLDAVLQGLPDPAMGGGMTVANEVQNDVIGPLLAAPPQAAPLRRRTPALAGAPVALQRKVRHDKPPKVTDPFEFGPWRYNQNRLRRRIASPRGREKTPLKTLELFDRANAAEKVRAQNTGPSVLPRKQDVIDVVSGKAPQQKVEKRPLAGLFTWMRRWTSEPAEMLGRFRAGFKGVFLKVAGLVANFGPRGLLERIKTKFQALFAELSKGKRGSALAEFAIKGVAFAIKQVAHLVLPSTFHLIASTLREGVRKKLAALFEIDAAALVQETFDRFKGWLADLNVFGGTVGGIVQKVADALGGVQRVIEIFRKVADYVDTAATYIKWGVRIAQCSGILSCLTLIFESVKEKAIRKLGDLALKICGVRYLIAKGVRALFGDVPALVARGILDFLRDLVPDSLPWLRELLGEKVPDEPLPEASEIVDPDCFSIDLGFSILDGFKTPKGVPGRTLGEGAAADVAHKLMEMAEQAGPDKLEALTKLMKKHGASDDSAWDAAALDALRALLRDADTQSLRDLAEGKATEATAKKLAPLTDQIDRVARAKRRPKVPPAKAAPKQAPAPQVPAPPRIPAKPGQRLAWSPNDLHIWFVKGTIAPGAPAYEESPVHRTRPTGEEREFQPCTESGTFVGSVYFVVDYPERPRPRPFGSPEVTVKWRAGGREIADADAEPGYVRAGAWLRTSFDPLFQIEVRDKETLAMEFVLKDGDTGTTVTYADSIRVRTVPCA